MRRASITNKMALYFVSLSFTVVGILGLLSYLQTKDALFERTYNQLTTIKSVKKRQLTKFFDERISDMAYLSEVLNTDCVVNNSADKEKILQKISQFLQYNKIYNFAVITGLLNDKEPLFIVTPKAVLRSIIDTIGFPVPKPGATIVSEVFYSTEPEQQNIICSAKLPVNYTNGVLYLHLSIDPESINDIMLEQSPGDGFGNSVESFLAGADKLLRTKSRFIDNSVLKIKVDTKGYESARTTGDGNSQYKDYRNIDVLGAYGRFAYSGLDWTIFAEIDVDEAYKPINNMLYNMLLYTFGISIILFLFTYYLSKRFMIPIKNLTEASAVLSSGSYPNPVIVENDDELGILGDTFNKMIDRLKNQELELETERLNRATVSIDSSDAERKRLSRELHDGLGQAMTAIKLKLESIDTENPEMAAKLIKNIKSDVDSTIGEIRNISNGLMPAVLLEFGIVNALRNLCDEITEHSNIEIRFSQSYKAKLSGRAETYLYRIAQEGLKNIIKHSEANLALVNLFTDEKFTCLSLNDNGKGFEPERAIYGNGVFNMRERVKIIGGDFTINSSPGKGTEILIKLKNNSKIV